MGFVSAVVGGLSQSGQYSAKKNQALVNGRAQKNAAYAQATSTEQAAKANLRTVAENMARMAGNRRRDMGAARNANAASGFTSDGSGSKAEEVANKVHTQAMADLARSGSTASMNAQDAAITQRRQGDMALRAAEIEAEQYAAMAKASRTGAFMSALGGVVGAVGGAVDGYGRAEEFNKANADAIAKGDVKEASLWRNSVLGGVYGSDGGAGLLAATNPFTAAYAGESWQRNLIGMFDKDNVYRK